MKSGGIDFGTLWKLSVCGNHPQYIVVFLHCIPSGILEKGGTINCSILFENIKKTFPLALPLSFC